jgi:hypothetical protein
MKHLMNILCNGFIVLKEKCPTRSAVLGCAAQCCTMPLYDMMLHQVNESNKQTLQPFEAVPSERRIL